MTLLMSLPLTDPATLALRSCNNKKIRASSLRLADRIARQILYPGTPDVHNRNSQCSARQVALSPQQRDAARCQLLAGARTTSLRALPGYIERFVDALLAREEDGEVVSAVKSYVLRLVLYSTRLTLRTSSQLLRYAVMEHADSGLRVAEHDGHPAGFVVYTTKPLHVGDRLTYASAHIARDASDRAQPRRAWFDGRPRPQDPKWLLGPVRFALFACRTAQGCCNPNCEVRVGSSASLQM